MLNKIIILIIFTPFIGSALISFAKESDIRLIRSLALYTTLIAFFLSAILWVQYNPFVFKFQFINKISLMNHLNINFFVGIDGISRLFILLTTLLFPICILFSWSIECGWAWQYRIFVVLEAERKWKMGCENMSRI